MFQLLFWTVFIGCMVGAGLTIRAHNRKSIELEDEGSEIETLEQLYDWETKGF